MELRCSSGCRELFQAGEWQDLIYALERCLAAMQQMTDWNCWQWLYWGKNAVRETGEEAVVKLQTRDEFAGTLVAAIEVLNAVIDLQCHSHLLEAAHMAQLWPPSSKFQASSEFFLFFKSLCISFGLISPLFTSSDVLFCNQLENIPCFWWLDWVHLDNPSYSPYFKNSYVVTLIPTGKFLQQD